jgi:NitT/TauT family transport system substrate-binding protein
MIRLLAAAFALLPAAASAETPVKFVLDWIIMGTQAPFSDALVNKYFQKEGLNVSIDRGYGSADSIAKVGNGLYDFGFADANLLVKYNHDNPDAKVTLVFLVQDRGQLSIVARRSAGIAKLADLAGKKIGAPPGDNSRQIFPVYAKAAGFDASTVNWVSAQPSIENTMLFRGDIDAVAELEPSAFQALAKLGMDPAKDLISFRYAEYLPELMGSGVITSEKTIKERPDLVRAFVKAVVMGEQDSLAHPAESVATLRSLSSLINVPDELARWNMGVEMTMADPALKTRGLGSVEPERLKKATADMAETFNVPVPANLSEIYNASFLPPLADRQY